MFSKLLLRLVVFMMFFSSAIVAQDFKEFSKQYSNSYIQYKDDINKEFKNYKKAYDESFKEYTSEIQKKWATPEVSTKHKWVEYSDDYNSKKSIDYENKKISIEVIANSEKEAKQKIARNYDKMINYSVDDGIKNDILEKKIAKKIQKLKPKSKSKIQLKQKLIADILNIQEQIRIKKKLLSKKMTTKKYKGKIIYKANVKLPPNSLIKKARNYRPSVQKESKKAKVPTALVYAIMHSESSFNPMARSHIPAYGLMQIVPRSAGVDTYRHLYGKKKLLSSSYLYNPDNNILIGSNYLHILYFKYLRKIKDPQSRLYCTIAAYNTGAGNVAKAFIGNTNISKASRKINKMSSDQVYKTLMKKLPYNETKKYLVKVNDRMNGYAKLIAKGKL